MDTIDICCPSQRDFIRFLFFIKSIFSAFNSIWECCCYLPWQIRITRDKYFIMAVQYAHLLTLPVDSTGHLGKAVMQVGQVVIVMQTTSVVWHPSRAERCNLLINLMDKKYKTPKNTLPSCQCFTECCCERLWKVTHHVIPRRGQLFLPTHCV